MSTDWYRLYFCLLELIERFAASSSFSKAPADGVTSHISVEARRMNAYVACSWAWQRKLQKYAERISDAFNDVVAPGDLAFYRSFSLIVVPADDR